MAPQQIVFSDKCLEKIIHNYTREAGVRNLERRIGDVCRKAARKYLEKKQGPIRINEGNLEKYLGKERVSFEDANEEDEVGIVRGLAWTSVGGDTLQIEVKCDARKGKPRYDRPDGGCNERICSDRSYLSCAPSVRIIK